MLLQTHQNHTNNRHVIAENKRELVLQFIYDHIRQEGYPPSRDAAAQHVGFTNGGFIARYITYYERHHLIEVGQDGYLMPTLTPDDLKVKNAIAQHFEQAGYPPTFEEIQTQTQLDTERITYALRLLQLKQIVRWDESKSRGIYWRKGMPNIKQWHDTASRAADRAERIAQLKAQLPQPTPENVIMLPMKAPAMELHVPAKINANGVFSIVSTNMSYHAAAIEDICGSVSDYAANILRIRHDDPARGEIFEVSIRALVNLAAEMIGASAYLVFSDSEPDNRNEATNERTVKIA